MTQPHPPYSAKRKAWIGAGIALAAVAIVVRYGFDTVPTSEDVAGTVVPAQRYRAPQAAPDIQLGDQSLAQLMQNDAFVRLIRDPQVQAMVREPGFAEAAALLRDHPEAARLMLEHSESASMALASPELAKAMEANAMAVRAMERTVAAAVALRASTEANKVFAQHRELERYVQFIASLERKAGEGQQDFPGKVANRQIELVALDKQAQRVAADRLLQLNAEQAQRVAERALAAEKRIDWRAMDRLAAGHTALQSFVLAHQTLSNNAMQYVEAAKVLNANPAAAQLVALDARAARVMMSNPDAARAIARTPAAMKAVLAFPDAARVMLAQPAASRYLLQNTEAARLAVERTRMEHTAAERATAAERIQK